jgi:hypothetical protein
MLSPSTTGLAVSRGRAVLSRAVDSHHADQRHELGADLRLALERKELELHY